MSTSRAYVLAPLGVAIVAVLLWWMAQERLALAVTLGLVFSLTALAALAMASLERGRGKTLAPRAAPVAGAPAIEAPRSAPAAQAALAFRVIGTRGRCTLGRRVGDLVQVGADGRCTPGLCADAEATLRLAAKAKDAVDQRWCCPVYDHLLVFQRVG